MSQARHGAPSIGSSFDAPAAFGSATNDRIPRWWSWRSWSWRRKPTFPYRSLDSNRIVETAFALCRRIRQRFPDASLARVAADVEMVARESARRVAWCAAPQWAVRSIVLSLTAVGLSLLVRIALNLRGTLSLSAMTVPDLLQMAYNVVNDLILVGIALIFVWGWETRIRRGRALRALHELRALAHIADMHQLAKDPKGLLRGAVDVQDGPQMTRDELIRYLIYCTDLLALLGKIAALYAQELADQTVLGSVNEIEELTTALSQKIWQKITLVDPDNLPLPGLGHS